MISACTEELVIAENPVDSYLQFCKKFSLQYFRTGWRSHWRLSQCTTGAAAWRTRPRPGLLTKVSTLRSVQSVRRRGKSFSLLNMALIRCLWSGKDWRCVSVLSKCQKKIFLSGRNVDVWSPSETFLYRGITVTVTLRSNFSTTIECVDEKLDSYLTTYFLLSKFGKINPIKNVLQKKPFCHCHWIDYQQN